MRAVGDNQGVNAASVKADPTLVAAVDLARGAVVAEAGQAGSASSDGPVGAHLGVQMEADRVATHMFACTSPAYVGWYWAVTLVRAARSKAITVNDVVLLPGAGALVAPPWVPWAERVRPGDLSPGDVLPTAPDDARLVPGLTGADDLESVASTAPLAPGAWEIGLGRVRVLSAAGRDDAAHRWVDGDFGPASTMARQAANSCATCGFMLPVGGPLGQQFALCANELSPADGHVVALTFGCGAHSEVTAEQPARAITPYDATGWDPVDLGDLGHS